MEKVSNKLTALPLPSLLLPPLLSIFHVRHGFESIKFSKVVSIVTNLSLDLS